MRRPSCRSWPPRGRRPSPCSTTASARATAVAEVGLGPPPPQPTIEPMGESTITAPPIASCTRRDEGVAGARRRAARPGRCSPKRNPPPGTGSPEPSVSSPWAPPHQRYPSWRSKTCMSRFCVTLTLARPGQSINEQWRARLPLGPTVGGVGAKPPLAEPPGHGSGLQREDHRGLRAAQDRGGAGGRAGPRGRRRGRYGPRPRTAGGGWRAPSGPSTSDTVSLGVAFSLAAAAVSTVTSVSPRTVAPRGAGELHGPRAR